MEETQVTPDRAFFCVRFQVPTPESHATELHERKIVGFAEACLQLTPRIALRSGGEALFLDLRHIAPKRFGTVPTRLRWLAKRFELEVVSIAEGASARASWLASCDHRPLPIEDLPITLLPELLDPFQPDPDQVRAVEKNLPTLQALGIHTIGHFAKLPARKLSSRFGKLGLFLQNAVTCPREIWPVFLPPEKLTESFQLTDPETQTGISGTDSLLYVLKRLGEKLFARLRGRALRASHLSVELLLENQETRHLPLRLLVPQSSILSCLPTLRDRLTFEWEQKNPLPCTAVEIRLTVDETAPGAGSQHDFFSREEREEEATEALFLRLQEKLGPQSSYRAQLENTHHPERSWSRGTIQKSSRPSPMDGPPRSESSLLARRPSRLCVPPRPAPRDWRVRAVRIEGPERILRTWWEESDSAPDRDYFRVLTREGERVWIAVTRDSSGEECAWIHGWFD